MSQPAIGRVLAVIGLGQGLTGAGVTTGRTAILVIFVLTYCGIAVGHVPGLRLNRTGIALLGAIGIMTFSGLPLSTVLGFNDGSTILLLFGFFVLSAQLQLSGFFDQVATHVVAGLDRPAPFLFVLMVVTAALSAVLNHDIVCLVFTPVVGAALLRKRLNPVPFLVALAIASNIGAAATPIGSPQDMMIAQIARLDFGPYILWCITPVVVVLGVAYAIIWRVSRDRLGSTVRNPEPVSAAAAEAMHPYDRRHTIKGLVILAFVIVFFFSRIPKEIVALTAAGIHLASAKFRTEDLLSLVDWPILILFMALFMVTGAFQSTGYGDQVMRGLEGLGVNLQSPRVLTLVAAALSNLINNSAAAVLLVKMVDVHHPVTAYVLSLATSFGGSLVVIGSVSNIIVVQQARDLGIEISFRDFARIGVPVTVSAVAVLLIWVTLMS